MKIVANRCHLSELKCTEYDFGRKSAPDPAGRAYSAPPDLLAHDTIRYDTKCYFNVRSKADISQLNLPHGTDN